jgi:HTH-type transcriptional regulator/antitoxin HipB
MKDITLRSAEQLGLTIRLKRKDKHLSQSALAEILGVERKWVLRLEAGNPTAELGLVLKAISSLGMRLALSDGALSLTKEKGGKPDSTLDEVFRRLQKARTK